MYLLQVLITLILDPVPRGGKMPLVPPVSSEWISSLSSESGCTGTRHNQIDHDACSNEPREFEKSNSLRRQVNRESVTLSDQWSS